MASKFTCFLFVCFAIGTSSARWRNRGSQTTGRGFCRDHECPDYQLIREYRGYELREYNSTVWACTPMARMSEAFWEDIRYNGGEFMKLFRYIQGANDRKMTMKMTTPVITEHRVDSVTRCFLIPSEFSMNPPQPTEDNVYIQRKDGFRAYVKSFGGFAQNRIFGINHYKDQLFMLHQDLKRDNQKYDTEHFITAGYDEPTRIFNRHNEVWCESI